MTETVCACCLPPSPHSLIKPDTTGLPRPLLPPFLPSRPPTPTVPSWKSTRSFRPLLPHHPSPSTCASTRAAATTASDRPGHRSLTLAHWPLRALVWPSALPLPFTPQLPPLSLLPPLVRPSLGHAIAKDKAAAERERPFPHLLIFLSPTGTILS